MPDYQPLDLSRFCNAGVEVLGDNAPTPQHRLDAADLAYRGHSFFPPPDAGEVALGLQTFRGLPFMVGPETGDPGGSCFLALDGSGGSVIIPIDQHARRVIFAHRLLENPKSGRLGTQIAEHILHLAGGSDERVPIRDGFEIGVLGQRPPFCAVSDGEAVLIPRYEGSWSRAGRRQHEAFGASPLWYYLWSWENPGPDRAIESVEVVPSGPRFIIAAITLGHVDEDPFAREARRPARVVLTRPDEAEQPFDLDVEVDRGDATYAHPLPQATSQAFLADTHKGWGQAQNATSNPSYVEVSAVPSATVTVKRAGQEIGRVNWGEVAEKGAAETPRMRLELLDQGKNWVHVTVLDDDTGRPVPCRVHFRSPEGVPFQPYGHHNHVNSNLGTFNFNVGGDVRLGQITYAYIDGTCQGWLPRGQVTVDVARGYEYEPLRTNVTIAPGQRELTLRLKRWTHMNGRRWFSGDSHVHALSAQGCHTESQGEDLNVVNLVQTQWGSQFSSIQEFTGEPSVTREGDNIVYVCQENRQSRMGHLILWGLKRPVMPWCTDGLGEAEIGGAMEITLSDWADQCHAQGGTVIAPHFGGLSGETVALIVTGRLDGLEMIYLRESSHEQYYRALNCGYRLPLLGGTDKMSADVPVGLYRTYVRVPEDEDFSYESWCRNVARGRTFLSSGPMVGLTVDGAEIGDTVSLSGQGTVEVEAWAESIFPLHRLEIVQAGRVVAATESKRGTRRLELKERLKVDSHTWLAARCGGTDYYTTGNYSSSQTPSLRPIANSHYDCLRKGIFAHTSPIYVSCGGDWWMFDEDTARHMLTILEGDLAYIRQVSVQHRPGTVTHHHGEEDHTAYLERPFHEAREAIYLRMRGLGIAP